MTRTRLAVITLSILFAISLVPGLAFAAGDADDDGPATGDSLAAASGLTTQEATKYNLWVADVQVTSENASNITGEGISGKVSFDATTNTLTLNNATISKDHMAAVYSTYTSPPTATYFYYNIYQVEDSKTLTIKLVGTNKLKSPYDGTNMRHRGIGFGATEDDLVITGSGSLTVTAHPTEFIIGIECAKLTVDSKATVTVKITADNDSCTAVRASELATVKGTLNVSASGDEYATGLSAVKGLVVAKSGKVVGTAKDKGTSSYSGASAIYTYNGNSTINGYMKATSTWSAIEGNDGIIMTVGATGEVIAKGNRFAFEDMNVKLASKKLQVLAGNKAKSAKAVKVSKIGEAKYVYIGKAKKANTITVKPKTVSLSASKVKSKDYSVTAKKAFTVKKAKGTLVYKKTSGNKKITVAKNGKVTVMKGTAKGTYKFKVKVTAAGNSNYKAGSKTVTLVVKVK